LIKQAFLEFMQSIMSDYHTFFKDIFYNTDGSLPSQVTAKDCFKFKKFRKHKN